MSAQAKAAVVALLDRPPELYWAQAKTTAACMQAAGFRWPLYEFFTPMPARRKTLAGVPGPLDPAVAREIGYGSDVGQPSQTGGDPDVEHDRYVASLSKEQRRAFYRAKYGSDAEVAVTTPDGVGVSANVDGCIAEGRAAVYGSVEDYLLIEYVPQGIRLESGRALKARGVTAAAREYSRLMADAGYRVANPGEARVLARQRFGSRPLTGPASAEEKAMAVADARAQAESGVYEAITQASVVQASAWLASNEQLLVELAEIKAESLVRAGKIIRS